MEVEGMALKIVHTLQHVVGNDIGVAQTECTSFEYLVNRQRVGVHMARTVHCLCCLGVRGILTHLAVAAHNIEAKHRHTPRTLVLAGIVGIPYTVREVGVISAGCTLAAIEIAPLVGTLKST